MAFVVALAISVLATPIAGRLGRALGLVDRPADALKIHRAPVSILGGVGAVGAAFAAAAALGHPPSGWVLGAGALALALGLADDVRALPASARAAGPAAAGALLVAGGLRLEPLGVLGGAAMVFAAVACANAVNMLDGQDGLAGGLAAGAALGLAGVAGPGTGGGPELGLALTGALIGFLVWNRPPARVFLGNGGAYAVGVLLAALTAGPAGTGWPGLLAAAAGMGVFPTRRARPPWPAGCCHGSRWPRGTGCTPTTCWPTCCGAGGRSPWPSGAWAGPAWRCRSPYGARRSPWGSRSRPSPGRRLSAAASSCGPGLPAPYDGRRGGIDASDSWPGPPGPLACSEWRIVTWTFS